jgi:hypothetical protein
MPLLLYPTTEPNVRRGYYITDGDVATTVSALFGEPLNFRFNTSESIIDAGTLAQMVLHVDLTNVTTGETFELAGQLFEVDNTVAANTDKKVNFNQSNGLTHAQNLAAMIQSNLFFAGRVSIQIAVAGGGYDVTVKWLQKGEQFTGTNTMPGTYTVVSDAEGTAVELVNDYRLIYQVWATENGVAKPITDLRAIQPVINTQEVYNNIQIEVNDALKAYLKLDFPYTSKTTSANETAARRQFWLRYGYSEVETESGQNLTLLHQWHETPKEWVIYAALQETDRYGLRPYLGGLIDDALSPVLRKFLTKRPTFAVCPRSIGWLYVYLDDKERFGITSLAYRFNVSYWNGASYTSLSTNTLGTTDGLYRLPAHPGNLPVALPAGVTQYRIRVDRLEGVDSTILAEQVWQVKRGICCRFQVWFLGDLCSYEDLAFDELQEETVQMDNQIVALPINVFDNDNTVNYGGRLIDGGRTMIYSRNYRRYTGRIVRMCDEENARAYVEMFLKSPLKYVRFLAVSDLANSYLAEELQRAIFVDPESVVIKRDGELVNVDITFYFHNALEVQL